MTRSLIIETLGDLLDHDMRASLWCNACLRHGEIDVAAVAAKVGREWVFIRRRWPVMCARCGSGDVHVHIRPTLNFNDQRAGRKKRGDPEVPTG